MNTFSSYRLLITPLSPIHIGTGESYEPTNYVIDDGVLHEFDTGTAINAFSLKDREELLNIANRKPNEDMLKGLQRFFHDRRNLLKPWAINTIPVLPGVAGLYADRVGQTANHEAGGRQVLNRLEIDRTGYNPTTRQPILFGSSLKGSIRTALLDQENNGKALQQVTDRRTGKVRKENNQELQQRLFQYQAGKFELDPFRLVQLSDAHWQKGDELPSTQVHLAVNRKKAPVIDTNGQLRKAMGDHLYQILECTSPWRYRAFAGQLNLQDVNNLRQQQSLPDRALRFSIKTIARACHHFYEKAFINEINEIKGMGERGYLNKAWGKTVLEIFAIAKEKFQNGEAFLLRVGRHSGAESVTITGVRDIKIMEGKDPSTGNKRFSHAPTAKTLWLAADTQNQQTDLIPFGWLLVEIHPLDAPAPDWLELQGLCEPHLNFARQFAAKRREQAEILVKARLEAETKRRAEEEAERHRAEQKAQAAREEAERKAKLDAMSPAMQAVERFRELYLEQKQKGRYQPGGSFDQQRRTMITEALQWQDQEARRALSVLLRDSIKNWTEWPNKKERKAELKGWLEQLETPRD